MAEVEEEVKLKKVYDLEKDEFVEKPVSKKDTDHNEEDEKDDEEEEKEKKEENKEDTDKTKKSEEEEEEEEEEDDKKEEDKESSDDGFDETINELYGEEYEITSREELDEVLEGVVKVMEENDLLKEQLKSKSKPEFASEAQKKAYNFISKYDPEQHADALETWARVVNIDVDKADSKSILRENYVLSRPEISRQDAINKFERDYIKKYQPKKENFDSDEAYEEAKGDAEIDLKSDVALAKKALKETQKEYQYTPTNKKEEKSQEIPKEVMSSIEQNVKSLDAYQKNFTEIIFEVSDKKEDNFNVKFNSKQISDIKAVTKSWMSNPGSYDKNGNLILEWDSEEATIRAAWLLYGDEMFEKLSTHLKGVYSMMRAEEIGKVKPDRTSRITNGTIKEKSEDDQWDSIIDKKKKK